MLKAAFKKLKFISYGTQLSLFGFTTSDANPKALDTIVSDEEINEEETGWSRVKNIFIDDIKNGATSPEMEFVTETVACTFLAGFIKGGIEKSHIAYHDFITQNKLSSFTSHYHAKRELQDSVIKAFIGGGFPYGARLVLFVAPFTLMLSALASYNNRISVHHFPIAGAIAGTIYKIKDGPKPMVAGFVGGSMLAFIPGLLIVGIIHLTGYQYAQLHEMDKARIDKQMARIKKKNEEKYKVTEQHYKEGTSLAELQTETKPIK